MPPRASPLFITFLHQLFEKIFAQSIYTINTAFNFYLQIKFYEVIHPIITQNALFLEFFYKTIQFNLKFFHSIVPLFYLFRQFIQKIDFSKIILKVSIISTLILLSCKESI